MGDYKYDLLIRNGHVIDPANNINEPFDIAVKDGVIEKVARSINPESATKSVDVKGNFVIPGIIDMHSHVYPLQPAGPHCLSALNADAHLLKAGVTTTVDAGTAGWRDILYFKEQIIDRSRVRILAFLNIAACGMIDMRSEQNIADLQPQVTASVAKQYSDIIVGIKAAHYWPAPNPFDEQHPPWASVDNAVEAGSLCNMPAMIDFQPNLPECPYPELITERLRPGDIHTHVFAQQFPIINKDRKVYDHMWKAREKGVYFDVGHGSGSFWFRNGLPALQDGFPPDTLSTDLHMGNIHGAVLSMLQLMSKFHNMGMSLQEVILRSTSMPAKLINRPELGTLSVGKCADIAVIRKLDGDYGYVDCGGGKINGTSELNCCMTIREGKILYDGYGMAMPNWEEQDYEYL